MTWTNVFALAAPDACGIDVTYAGAGGNTGWSGSLGLDESSPEFPDFYGTSSLVVSINSIGVVSLDVVSGEPMDAAGISVKVTRSDSEDCNGTRASGITINGAATGGVDSTVKFSSGETVVITGDASTWTPDPAEVDSDSGYVKLTAGYLT